MSEKLSIAEYGYDDIRDIPLENKISLERCYQQSDARIHFSRASTDAMIAGTFALSSVLAAVSFGPVLLLGAIPALYFVGSSVNQFGKGLLHANISVQPDSAVHATIQQYELENPPPVIQQPVMLEGRLEEERALSRV